jgi:hypothetical protein
MNETVQPNKKGITVAGAMETGPLKVRLGKKRWVGKETVIEFQSGTAAIEGYFQFERVDSL